MKRVRVRASGRVQGVFFRDTMRGEASDRGVAGWVANRSDGTVEAVFEGAPKAVEELVDLCRGGPGQADVDEVDIAGEEPEGLEGFEVR